MANVPERVIDRHGDTWVRIDVAWVREQDPHIVRSGQRLADEFGPLRVPHCPTCTCRPRR